MTAVFYVCISCMERAFEPYMEVMISGITNGHFDIIFCLEIHVSALSYHILDLKK